MTPPYTQSGIVCLKNNLLSYFHFSDGEIKFAIPLVPKYRFKLSSVDAAKLNFATSYLNSTWVPQKMNLSVSNPILFGKYLDPLNRTEMVLYEGKKKQFENPIIGSQNIKQKPSLIFLEHPVCVICDFCMYIFCMCFM